MPVPYEERLIGSGKNCSISILVQDGPLTSEVYEVTQKLLRLADRIWDAESMKQFAAKFPAGTRAGTRTAAVVGSGFHDRLFDLAKQAQRKGVLPGNMVITVPTTRKNDPTDTRKIANIRKGPDFVWRGLIGGHQIDAAWDFTTNNALSAHYDRDVLGKRRGDQRQRPDLGIQQVEDKTNFWTSYIAICY